MLSTHTCPVEGCIAVVAHDKLMCRRHWHLVPPDLQAAVYNHWHRGRPSAYYVTVRDAAIRQAHEQEIAQRRGQMHLLRATESAHGEEQ